MAKVPSMAAAGQTAAQDDGCTIEKIKTNSNFNQIIITFAADF